MDGGGGGGGTRREPESAGEPAEIILSEVFPFSPFEFPLLNGQRAWIAKALEVESGFAILKTALAVKKSGGGGPQPQ